MNFGDSFFIAFAAMGLFLVIFIEQAQIIAKYWGVVRGQVAGGYNAAMKIMVLNRVGAVLFFFFCALSIDLGANAENLAVFFIAAIMGIAVSNLTIIYYFKAAEKINLFEGIRQGIRPIPVIASFISTVFGTLGLTIPMLLSAENPSLRLTMANTGFFFNAVFTIMMVFFVESYLAKLIDQNSDNEVITRYLLLVYLMRFLAALTAIGVLFILHENSDILAFTSSAN